MDISSEEFINFYSVAVHPKPSQISPICISPFTSNDDSLHVQVIPTPKPTSELSESDYPSYKIIRDENCFYQITNNNLMTLVQKISQNRCVWNIPAFFPSKFVAASLSNDLLFIGLSDKTINIVDTNTGVCCFPSVFVDDKIIYLISEDNYVICFTSNNYLTIWEIVNSQYLRSIIQEKYEGPELGNIQKVILTNELENDTISPIIFSENITVRFSKTRNGWINANCNIPTIFSKKVGYRTIYDVEKGFFKSLINDEIEEFHNCMTILLQKYLKSERFNRVTVLVVQLLNIISTGKKSYCGMDPKDLLSFMLKIIEDANPEMANTIINSPQYHDALNPKPPNPPQQPKETQQEDQQQEIPQQEIQQSSILPPTNSNISPEQQEVIDIILKNKQNQQESDSIITQPNMSSETQDQNETFTWPNTNTQFPTQTTETPIQEHQEQLNTETNEITNTINNAIITSPNSVDETFSPPKVKSYNEDDGLTRAQKYAPESLPTPSMFNDISPIRQENKKKNISPIPINALDIVSSEAIPPLPQKPSISSPIKQQKKRPMKQGTLADFIQISPRKSEQKKPETNIETQEQNETQNSNNEQENESQSIQQRRSPRVSKKINKDLSPEPKKKTTKAQPKKKGGKAKATENEEEVQQQQIEEENETETNQQEIQETPKKTPNRKTPKKTNKKATTKEISFFLNENESTEQPATQQPLPIINSSEENQIIQPTANSEEPNPFITQSNNQLPEPIQPSFQFIQQPNIQPLQMPQMNIPTFLFNDPTVQSTQQFNMLPPQIQSQIIEYQKQHNIIPKRKSRAKPKNMSQITQIQPEQNAVFIQPQQQSAELISPAIQIATQQNSEQQSAEIFSPALQIAAQQNSEQQPEEENTSNQIEKKPKTPRKKSTTPRKARSILQQEQVEQVLIPQDEFITSIETQENTESSSLPLTKQKSPRARGKKASSLSQETNEEENEEQQNQSKTKRKSTPRQRMKKGEKSISQAPQLSIQNDDDEKLSAPADIEQNKLTIQEAQEMAEKMQQENQE